MEAQSYTAQERRAANQVWAAAGEYGFEPLFLARNTDGTVDFYMNCIVGLVHKYYGDDLVRGLFNTWDGDVKQSLLDCPAARCWPSCGGPTRIISSASSTNSRGRSGWRKTSWSTPCRPPAGGGYRVGPTRC